MLNKDLQDGISIITAVKNREQPLKYSLASWIDCPQVNQIVLIDWGCDTPLIDTLETMNIRGYPDERIVIGRCESPFWKPSHAFNLGLAYYVSNNKCLKLDADVVIVGEEIFYLDPDNLHMNYWANSTKQNRNYLTGSFFTATENIWAVGGYDEGFSESYGYEDDNLYDRIESSGVERKEIPMHYLYHLPHSDAERFENYEDTVTNPDKMYELSNSKDLNWTRNDPAKVKYTHEKLSDGYYLSTPIDKK